MADREKWRQVAEAEARRWETLSAEELLRALEGGKVYKVECDSRTYQVEVEILENTGKYVHVMVAVDDGSLPASLRPATTCFLRSKAAG